MRHLLLAGGGHAHVEVLRRLARQPLPGWRITVLSREAKSPYSGMLPGVVAGLYRREEALIDLPALARRAQADLIVDSLAGVNAATQRALVERGAPLGYDLLSVNTGARPDVTRVPGAAKYAIPLKPIDRLLTRLGNLAAGTHVALVGAGAGGTEMAFALAMRMKVTLVAGAAGLLPGFPDAFRRAVRHALSGRGITLTEGENVAEVTRDALLFPSAPAVPTQAVLWATGAAPPDWIAASGLPRDEAGFLLVTETLRVVGQDAIFAAGDIAGFGARALPKSGVHAVRQGPLLARNLRAAAAGGALTAYRPQRDALILLSLADGTAIGTRNGIVVHGRWVGRWKDWIDRRFMRRYAEEPA